MNINKQINRHRQTRRVSTSNCICMYICTCTVMAAYFRFLGSSPVPGRLLTRGRRNSKELRWSATCLRARGFREGYGHAPFFLRPSSFLLRSTLFLSSFMYLSYLHGYIHIYIYMYTHLLFVCIHIWATIIIQESRPPQRMGTGFLAPARLQAPCPLGLQERLTAAFLGALSKEPTNETFLVG